MTTNKDFLTWAIHETEDMLDGDIDRMSNQLTHKDQKGLTKSWNRFVAFISLPDQLIGRKLFGKYSAYNN